MTRNVLLFAALTLLAAGAVVWFILRGRTTSEPELLVHCGTSMRPAGEELARELERVQGLKVRFNFGDSETLLPSITQSRKGDFFICHDPFADLLQKAGLLAGSAVVGQLRPVIITAKGNPKGVRSLADLAQTGLRVGITDPRHATCGQLLEERLKALGLLEAVRKNIAVEARKHGELATSVGLGQLDAAVVWNFIAVLHKDKLETVALDDPFPRTNVTVCLLSCAENKSAAERLMNFAQSAEGRAIFERHGYR